MGEDDLLGGPNRTSARATAPERRPGPLDRTYDGLERIDDLHDVFDGGPAGWATGLDLLTSLPGPGPGAGAFDVTRDLAEIVGDDDFLL